MNWDWLKERPLVVAIAGPNGAGKTTFYWSHISAAGLRFVNTDVLAREIEIDPYSAARLAGALRTQLTEAGESFVFETVFSDPVGDKVSFLRTAVARGYTVVLCFIGLTDVELCEERAAMLVTQGGHDVPSEKLIERFPRTQVNLKKAITELPHVLIFDNSDLSRPFQQIAVFQNGVLQFKSKSAGAWKTWIN